MRIIVHREKCQGHARCWSFAPHIYDIDDEGFIIDANIDVPEGEERNAWKGAKSCPERALEIEE